MAVVWREEGFDDSSVNSLTLKELREQVMYARPFVFSLSLTSDLFVLLADSDFIGTASFTMFL